MMDNLKKSFISAAGVFIAILIILGGAAGTAKAGAGTILVTNPIAGERFKLTDTVNISWTMTGTVGPAGRVEIWLLEGGTKNILIKGSDIIPISPNTYSWVIPSTLNPVELDMNYKFRVISADDHTIYGDSGAVDIAIVQTNKPDLIVESARIDSLHYLIVSIKNIGDAEYNASTTYNNDLLNWSDLAGGLKGGKNNYRIVNIAPGKSEEFIATNTITSSGTHKIEITIDPLNFIAESNEANNVSTFYVDISPIKLPDLIVESAEAKIIDTQWGKKNIIAVKVKNIGDGNYIYTDSSVQKLITWKDSITGQSGYAGNYKLVNILPGESQEYLIDNIGSNIGSQNLSIAVDPDNIIAESNNYNNTYSIAVPSIKVVSPNGGEKLTKGKTFDIKWSSYGIDANSKVTIIAYANGLDLGTIASGINASLVNYSWTVPVNFGEGYNYDLNSVKIRVQDHSNYKIYDESDNNFSIVKPTTGIIQIISPNGGETIVAGQDVEISFINSLTRKTDVQITNCADAGSLCNGNNYGTAIVDGNADNTIQKATTNISLNAAPGRYKAVAQAVDFSSSSFNIAKNTSDAFFTIVSSDAGSIIVSSPLNNSTYAQGDSVNIKWTTSGAIGTNAPVKIWLIKGYDASILIKDSNILNEFNWTIPYTVFADPYNSYSIKVVSSSNIYISGKSGYFKVAAGIAPTSSPIPTPTPISASGTCILPDGTLVKLPNDPKIYVIRDCKKVWIQTVEEFNRDGYKWSDVNELPSSTVNSIPSTSSVASSPSSTPNPTASPAANISEGAMIQVAGDPDVYIVKYAGLKKFKRLILSPSVFKSYGHLKWENIINVDKAALDSFTTSNLVRSENGKIYRLNPSGDNGIRNHIKDMNAFQRLSLDMDSVYQINITDESSYSQGQELE